MYTNSFYNPYMTNMGNVGKAGLFGGLFKKFSLSGFLTGANKTLNVVNQAIPIYYQIKPMISNAKTMFRVASAVKNTNSKNTVSNNTKVKKENSYNGDGSPTFFI